MIDFSKEYSITEFDLLFDRCPYCTNDSIKFLHNDDYEAMPYVQYNFCITCNFAARFFFVPAFIDLIFNVSEKKHVNIVVNSNGVQLVENGKVLKILSTNCITDLKELQDLIQKYSVLI